LYKAGDGLSLTRNEHKFMVNVDGKTDIFIFFVAVSVVSRRTGNSLEASVCRRIPTRACLPHPRAAGRAMVRTAISFVRAMLCKTDCQ
ncbi:MAG: hypothetical protein K2N21_01295, partial [Rikenellaceae bacterium]|nr:hypothetical protein [Rikenellaceae bacterium]